jgi:hypothetical protein
MGRQCSRGNRRVGTSPGSAAGLNAEPQGAAPQAQRVIGCEIGAAGGKRARSFCESSASAIEAE